MSDLANTVQSYFTPQSQSQSLSLFRKPKMMVSVSSKKCRNRYGDIGSKSQFVMELRKLMDVTQLLIASLSVGDSTDKSSSLFIKSLKNLHGVVSESHTMLLAISNAMKSANTNELFVPYVKLYCEIRKELISEIRIVYENDLIPKLQKGMLRMYHNKILQCWDFDDEPLCKSAKGCDWQNDKCVDYWYWDASSCESYKTQNDCNDMGCSWNTDTSSCSS